MTAGMAGERSIADPTPLQVLATLPGTKLTWSQEVYPVESRESTARVTAIELEGANGQRHHGILVQLDGEDASDAIYIDQKYARQFMSELAHLEPAGPPGEPPTAHGGRRSYFEGIARCRPSQQVAQAFCPEYYTDYEAVPEPEEGLYLRTPRAHFRFPWVRPSALFTSLAMAIDGIRSRQNATPDS